MVKFYSTGGGSGILFQPTSYNISIKAPISVYAPIFVSTRTSWPDDDQFDPPPEEDFTGTFESMLPSSSSEAGFAPTPRQLESRRAAFILRFKESFHRILRRLKF